MTTPVKILIVANNNRNSFAPFVTEQAEALRHIGVNVAWFGVKGHGIWGYLRNLPRLLKTIRLEHPQIIHAHYGLCGSLACLQHLVPVVTTYHGSDINNPSIRRLSRLSLRRSECNIFVSRQLKELAGKCNNPSLLPCGINLEAFPHVNRDEARRQLGLHPSKKYVLFSSAFDNPVKNAPLAQAAIGRLPEAELLELKGYSRPQVNLLLHAVDCLLMTSLTEGSPQVIKEALACGTPIVSLPVGDVPRLIDGVKGCFIANGNDGPDSIADSLRQALDFQAPTLGREQIALLHLDNSHIALELLSLYEKTLLSRHKNHNAPLSPAPR